MVYTKFQKKNLIKHMKSTNTLFAPNRSKDIAGAKASEKRAEDNLKKQMEKLKKSNK